MWQRHSMIYNFISTLLLAAMFLSGICMTQITEDSYFAYQTSQPISTTLTILKTQPDSAVLSNDGSMSRHESLIRTRRNRRLGERTRLRFLPIIGLGSSVFLPMAFVSIYGYGTLCEEIYSLTVTIRYIQCQDGQKPSLMF